MPHTVAELKITDLDPERLRLVQELLWAMRSLDPAVLHERTVVLVERHTHKDNLLRDIYDHADAIEQATQDATIGTHADAIRRGARMLCQLLRL